MTPLGLAEGGSTAGFKLEAVMSMHSNTGVYKCGFNLALLSLAFPTPELPMSSNKKHSWSMRTLCGRASARISSSASTGIFPSRTWLPC
eukprot:156070-Pyramimonas_sp.AAC.1